MGIARGTNIVKDGLVFGYDSGYGVSDNNTSTRFYPGKPTINVHPHPLDIYAQLPQATSVRLNQERDTSVSSPLGGIAYKMTPTGADPYMATYNNSTYNLASAASGQTWTASVYVKANRATAASIFIFEANSSGAYTAADASTVNIGTDWQRISITRTFNQSNTAYVQARIDGPDTYAAGDILWFDGYQVEQQGSVTPFVNGTRSATTSLIDLKRTVNVDVSNVSFDSTGQPDFDGTDDRIVSSTGVNLSSYTSLTYEGVVKAVGLASHDRWFSGTAGSTFHNPDLAIGTDGQLLYIFANSGIGSWIVPSGLTIDTTKFNHLVYTFTNTGVVRIYVNGTQQYTATHSNATFPNGSRFMTGSRFDVNGEAVDGSIPITKVYSRALTADEVMQNYKAYKNRFNL
jgi:hypothetical protein